MATGNTQVVLELFGKSPLATVHSSGEFVQRLGPSATHQGLCRSLQTGQSVSTVTGVKLLNSILPGEVVY